MPTLATIHLEAQAAAEIDMFSGRAVFDSWLDSWSIVNPDIAYRIRQEPPPFSLSPLMGLYRANKGKFSVKAGQKVFIRISILDETLVAPFEDLWLKKYAAGGQINIPRGVTWKIVSQTAPVSISYKDLLARYLAGKKTPEFWRLQFLTPVLFDGVMTRRPLPMPEALIESWYRYWQAFCSEPLAVEELQGTLSRYLAVSAHDLRTVPGWDGERVRPGFVGVMTLLDLGVPRWLRGTLDLLIHYSVYCGSGVGIFQGSGLTQVGGS